ncbi:hypothetical protein [uncultured Sphingomonas sp.]|uniref:hypothetical protein n=1 Tax=uncultured Sphingomonas sp. TaxID=158754 RepID=UPI0025DA2C7D|nr:hypothetical protein [uncultured Sphingomonas sp.]
MTLSSFGRGKIFLACEPCSHYFTCQSLFYNQNRQAIGGIPLIQDKRQAKPTLF